MNKKQIFEDIQLNYYKTVLDIFRDKNVQKTIKACKTYKNKNSIFDFVWEMLNMEANSEISKLHDIFLAEYPYHKHKVQKQWIAFRNSSLHEALVEETKQRVEEEVTAFLKSKRK